MSKNKPKPTVAIDSLGCKLNQAEMESLARQLNEAGYTLVSTADRADIYILNSCTVTHIADRKTRQKLRAYNRINPDAKLIATGCYAERAAEELKTIDGVGLVVGNDKKSNIPKLIGNLEYYGESLPGPALNLYAGNRRTRSFLKIQDGCRNFCAYCIVPLVRSREESVPADRVISEIKTRVIEGFREVVLTGTEIGLYRQGSTDLKQLIERVLAETDVPRIRLSSLQPPEISPDFIVLWQNPRLCPHFHLSVQSGGDRILSAMKRRYNADEYQRTVTLIRDKVTDVAVTTDVIVGFPGESDAEFLETLDFCREMRFTRIHVFQYSPRPGTVAASLPHKISAAVKKERSQLMLSLVDECTQSFRESYLGRTMEVLFEQKTAGFWTGLTGNYIKVYVKSRTVLTNKLIPVKLGKIYRDGILGELL